MFSPVDRVAVPVPADGGFRHALLQGTLQLHPCTLQHQSGVGNIYRNINDHKISSDLVGWAGSASWGLVPTTVSSPDSVSPLSTSDEATHVYTPEIFLRLVKYF